MGEMLKDGHGATFTAPPRPPGGKIFRIGEVLSEAYEIRGFLGEGGMSQVFEAQDLALNRRVAIKACWPAPDGPPLRKEAQALAVLRHPSMAVVHTVGCHRGIDYLVMERIYGVTLKEHLRRWGPVDIGEAQRILYALAETLDAVHGAGVVHRDVKPANVILAPGDRIVLVDFGIFAAEFELGELERLAGTPQYLAPEMIQRCVKPGGGPLVDIYALGITAFEILTGALPFDDDSDLGLLKKQIEDPIPDLRVLRPEVPAALASLVAAMTAKDPVARPQTMEEVALSLRLSSRRERTAGAFTVLIVDDHGATLDLLRYALDRALPEAQILLAASAEEAISLVQRNPPSVITVDLELPGMNGVELCLYLQGARLIPDAALVVVSSHAQRPDVQLLAQLGVRHFIWKGGDYVMKVCRTMREMYRQRLCAGVG